jgi:hypothetical protein
MQRCCEASKCQCGERCWHFWACLIDIKGWCEVHDAYEEQCSTPKDATAAPRLEERSPPQ